MHRHAGLRFIRHAALAAALATTLLPASANLGPDQQARVAVGMTKAEVQAQIGSTRGRRHIGPTGHDLWRYRTDKPEEFLEIDFGPDGRVVGKSVIWVPPF